MKSVPVLIAMLCTAGAAVAAEPPRSDPQPAVQTSRPVAPGPAAPANSSPAAPATVSPAQDRIELEATQITGNRELPRVLYVVPWKRADLGDLSGRPTSSLLDEVLSPVDRDVFRRQNRYYRALKPDGEK
ncbi:MAG: hypothetical protein ABW278_12450 [Steroidobacteraceae bacterium]